METQLPEPPEKRTRVVQALAERHDHSQVLVEIVFEKDSLSGEDNLIGVRVCERERRYSTWEPPLYASIQEVS